ncbi:MAG: hypothetical protein OEW62_02610 [Candidatus Bathyarchaeota archaeon]|nr:hypothetical protein [Candidatus Bathyarchaeota archaeon]MDH5595346.1 hypothetical protein [Candidatus Bathyarchaeota archaeon]
MRFPERVYTTEEVKKAVGLIRKGYKHNLKVNGSPDFRNKTEKALELIKTAEYYDFLRTYIRQIREIDGLSQLREAEVAIWANKYAVADPIEAAGFIIQKAQQMKDFIEGRLYYETAEVRAVRKRIEFLETLRDRSKDKAIKKECEENLKRWTETTFP